MNNSILLEPIKLHPEWYDKFFDNINDTVFGVSTTGVILQVNSVFTSMFGYSQEVAVMANISIFIMDAFGGVSFEFYSKQISQQGDVFIHNFSGAKKDGGVFPIQVAITQVKCESNLNFIVAIRDESFKEKKRNKLEYQEFLLRQSQRYAGIGHWHYDYRTQQFDFSEGAKALLNIYTINNQVKLDALVQLFDSEDKNALTRAIDASLNGDKIEEQIRVIKANEELIWVEFQGDVEFSHGFPMMIHGILQDITQRKKIEGQENRLGFFAKHSLSEIFIFECETLQFIEVNELALNHWGYKKYLLTSMYCFDILNDFNLQSFLEILQPLIKGEQKSINFQAQAKCKNGAFYLLEIKIKEIQYAGKNAFVAFANDVTEREKSVAESYKAKEKAERENKEKSEFLLRMSHELRTPTNAISGFSQLIEADNSISLSNDQKDYFHGINKASDYLLKLTNDILDLSHVEAGQVAISIENININELISDVCLLVRPIAENYNVRLINTLESSPPFFLQADRVRLKQVLLNLISNGMKYSGNNKCVSIQFHINQQGKGVIAVVDNGPGIEEEKLKDLFIPFERLGAESTETEGTGIGLAIAKQMMELMKGEIGVYTKYGAGSCFFLTLPVGKEKIEQSVVSNINREPVKFINIENKSILYIEDNPANIKLVDRLLSQYSNCHFFYAATASMGLELAKAHQPDLILMDIHLPGISGVQAKIMMEEDAELSHIPVIAISSSASEINIEKAKKVGFVDYIIKPFEIKSFIEKANKYLL